MHLPHVSSIHAQVELLWVKMSVRALFGEILLSSRTSMSLHALDKKMINGSLTPFKSSATADIAEDGSELR